MTAAKEYLQRRVQQAIEAFKDHELVDNRDDRWRIAKRDKDGLFTNIHSAEIISLWGGRLFVGGDIDDCVFAYYSDKTNDHHAKLCWIGCHNDISYYVRQKASIGLTDGGKLVDEFDARVAEHDLDYHLKAELERIEERCGTTIAEVDEEKLYIHSVFERAKELVHDDPHELRAYLNNKLHNEDAWEWLGDIGNTVSARVIYAWAALRRLCILLGLYDPTTDKRMPA